jgi:hypothetical protein
MEFFHQNFINRELFLLQIKNYNKNRENSVENKISLCFSSYY